MSSIADIFNNPKAIINDPLEEIHSQVQSVDYVPNEYDYQLFLNHVNYTAYPKPTTGKIHHTVNPSHGALKPINHKL